jgi:hypothetical protein
MKSKIRRNLQASYQLQLSLWRTRLGNCGGLRVVRRALRALRVLTSPALWPYMAHFARYPTKVGDSIPAFPVPVFEAVSTRLAL